MRNSETVWRFNTGRIQVRLDISPEYNYRYDGYDEDGEIQEKIDNGEYVVFQSAVIVELNGEEIAADYLCGSVYHFAKVHEFWTAHRDRNPMNRNCSIQREKTGYCIAHYFPDMIREAVREARKALRHVD
jgi:hypothetical protein